MFSFAFSKLSEPGFEPGLDGSKELTLSTISMQPSLDNKLRKSTLSFKVTRRIYQQKSDDSKKRVNKRSLK